MCVGVVVLCLFIVFTYYCQNKFVNREEDRVHSLVEENYDDDEAVLDDGEGDIAASPIGPFSKPILTLSICLIS